MRMLMVRRAFWLSALDGSLNPAMTTQPRYVRLLAPLPIAVESGGESYTVEMMSYWDSLPFVAPQLRPQECHALVARPAGGGSDRMRAVFLSREFHTREELERAIESGWDITGGVSPMNAEAQPIIEKLFRAKAVEDLGRTAGRQTRPAASMKPPKRRTSP